MTAQTPTGPSAPETTSELRGKITPDREHVVAIAIHLAIEGDPSMLQRLEREAKTSSAASTTTPSAGDVDALRALSEKATQGEWAIDHTGPEENGYVFLKCTGAKRGGSDRTVPWHQMARFVVETDGKPSETGKANTELAIALVNAYRSGELVHRTHVLPAQTTTAAASDDWHKLYEEWWKNPLYDSCCHITAPAAFKAGWEAAKTTTAALAHQSAPATGGAARLDREAVARLLWSDENELRFHTPWSEARKDFYCAPESTMGITVGRTYKKADDILALDPVPQPHAASESDDRLWWFLHIIDASGGNAYAGDDKWNWINAFCDDRSGDVDTFNVARDRKLTRVEHDNRTEDSVVYITDAGRKYVAAITPAGRGEDAGGWRPIETAAARDVLAERQRQVEAENWTPEHDDTHAKGELAIAAACYATAPPAIYAEREWMFPDRPKSWPWHPSWWKPNFYRRNLVKAGALILAEIERLDRAAAPTAQGEA